MQHAALPFFSYHKLVKQKGFAKQYYKRVFCNDTKSLASKTTIFVNESHLLIWGKLQLGLAL